jgi:hypothetical protein
VPRSAESASRGIFRQEPRAGSTLELTLEELGVHGDLVGLGDEHWTSERGTFESSEMERSWEVKNKFFMKKQ